MMLANGARLGFYEILDRIGAGGMGVVYKARDTRLDRIVAIKVSNEQFSERFEREARAVAALNHPHICTLYDVGPNYLVMEYIDGTPLQGPLPVATAVRYVVEIAGALAAAHHKSITHRDLKPGNVMVTIHGIKLLDFGLAKFVSQGNDDATRTLELTGAGAVLGTPAYMAPEQLAGKSADARTDIFAAGAVLYELITGKHAYREREPLKDRKLEAIVHKCMAGDPAERYQSAEEMIVALEGSLRKSPRIKYAAVAAGIAVVAIAAPFAFHNAKAGPLLTDQDVLVVADFDNKTSDPVFDAALRQALAFQLEQSPFLKAMDEVQVREAITVSGRPQTTALTAEIAREVCLRQGAQATLEGSIASIGSSYLLSLQAVNCQSGVTLAREQAEAASKENVVSALGKATAAMRQKLGESLSNVQVEAITYKQALSTSSLEALASFRLGDRVFATGSSINALPHFLRAAELDPNFAMAFCVASIMYANTNQADKARDYNAKAYALLDQVHSERERLFINSEHYKYVGDRKKVIELQEVLVRMFPRDPIFHGNLASSYFQAGQFAKAADEAEAEIQNGPRISQGYGNAYGAYVKLDRTPDAKRVLERMMAQGINVATGHLQMLYIAFVEDDKAGQQKELKWLEGKPESAPAAYQIAENALALGQPGKAREAVGKNPFLGFAERVAMAETGRTPPPPNPMPANPTGQALHASGQSLLEKGDSAAAAAEFQRIRDHKLQFWGPFYPLAYIGLARAETKAGDTAKAKKNYEELFALWKNAEPNLPVMIEARKEYAQLE